MIVVNVFILALILFLFFFSKLTKSSKPPLPPGPKPLPFIGSVIPMLSNTPTFRWIHKLMNEMHTNILCIRIGNIHVVAVSDPGIAREFLKNNDAIFTSRPDCMSGYLSSDGYLTTVLRPLADDHWKTMRRVLATEVLSPARHKWLQCKRDEEADNLLRYIYMQCQTINSIPGGVINIRTTSQYYCGNVMRKICFGTRYFGKEREDSGPGKEEKEHVDNLFTVLQYIYGFCLTDYFPWLRWITDFDGHEKAIRSAIKTARKYQDALIDERIQQWNDGLKNNIEDLLDVFINIKSPKLTADQIKAQFFEMHLAGVDNPSSCIEWAMAEMLNQPSILEKAINELDHYVGNQRLVQESDLDNLNYIKACAREAFRLHPIAPFNLPHVSTADTIVAGYFIPKESHVILSRIGLGRNPNVWEDPLKFNPDRHINNCGDRQVMLTDHELQLLSFSTGRRGCPATLLGSTMTTMLLARLLHGFKWEVPNGEKRVDLTESYDVMLKAEPLLAFAKPRLPNHLYPI